MVCRFLAAVCGEPQGSPAPVTGLLTRTPFATPFASVSGGDSTQRELSMEDRYAYPVATSQRSKPSAAPAAGVRHGGLRHD